MSIGPEIVTFSALPPPYFFDDDPERDRFERDDLLRSERLGTLAPLRRASESPIAIACLRLFTLPPLPPLPRRRVPRFRRRIVLSTFLPAALPYRRFVDFRFADFPLLAFCFVAIGAPRTVQVPACTARTMRVLRHQDAPGHSAVWPAAVIDRSC